MVALVFSLVTLFFPLPLFLCVVTLSTLFPPDPRLVGPNPNLTASRHFAYSRRPDPAATIHSPDFGLIITSYQ